MARNDVLPLEEQLVRLEEKLTVLRTLGSDSQNLAQRIETDLLQMMNSAWLTCYEQIERHERENASRLPNPAAEAIQFALADPEGMAFLRCWQQGQRDVIRREWPDCPESVFLCAETPPAI